MRKNSEKNIRNSIINYFKKTPFFPLDLNKEPIIFSIGSNKKYSFLNILKIVFKHFYIFLVFVSVFCGASFLLKDNVAPITYSSNGVISTNQIVHDSVFRTTVDIALSDNASKYVYDTLLNDNITHSDGKAITYNEIAVGIKSNYDYQVMRIYVFFTSTDKTIVLPVTNLFLEYIISEAANDHENNSFKYLFISDYAQVINTGQNNQNIVVFIGLAIGAILGVLSCLLFDNAFAKIINPTFLTQFSDVICLKREKNNFDYQQNFKILEMFFEKRQACVLKKHLVCLSDDENTTIFVENYKKYAINEKKFPDNLVLKKDDLFIEKTVEGFNYFHNCKKIFLIYSSNSLRLKDFKQVFNFLKNRNIKVGGIIFLDK